MDVTGILAIIFIFGLPGVVALVLGLKWMTTRNTERMGLINQGIIPVDTPRKKANPNRLRALRNGILLVSLGIAIIVGFLLSNLAESIQIGGFFSVAASVLVGQGIGYLIFFFITRKMKMTDDDDDENNLTQE